MSHSIYIYTFGRFSGYLDDTFTTIYYGCGRCIQGPRLVCDRLRYVVVADVVTRWLFAFTDTRYLPSPALVDADYVTSYVGPRLIACVIAVVDSGYSRWLFLLDGWLVTTLRCIYG